MKRLLFLSVMAIIISASYMVYSRLSDNLNLTDDEMDWLKSRNGLITVSGDPYYPPLDYINSKCMRDGIAEDIIVIIEEKLNVKFKRVNYSSWTEVVWKMRSGELDVISCIANNETRNRYMSFTPPYLSVPTVIVVHDRSSDIFSMADLKDKRVAIPLEYGSYEYFRSMYPGLKIIATSNDEESLEKVSSGEVDAAITDQPVMSYLERKQRFKNLSIRTETEYIWDYSIASRKDLPVLNSILSKAVKSISERERNSIANNWFGYRNFRAYLTVEFISVLLLIIGIISMMFLLSVFFYREHYKGKSYEKADLFHITAVFKNRVLGFFLSAYENEDYVVIQKSRAFVIIAIMTVAVSLILIIPSLFLDKLNPVFIISIISGLILVMFSLYLTKIGRFKIASHTFLIILFISTWVILFNDRGDLLRRLDTITFVLAFISFTPLIITHKKIAVLIYTGINMIIFSFYAIYTGRKLGLSNNSIAEYMYDVTIPLLLSGFISYFILSIYMEALQIARKSELEFQRKNSELIAANDELEEMYDRLGEVSNEMVGMNLKLSDEKELLATTLRSMDEAVLTTDSKGNIIMMNRAAEMLTGWEHQSARGVLIDRVIPLRQEHQSEEHEELSAIISDCGEPMITDLDNTYLIRDGVRIHVSGSSSPIIDADGRLSGMVVILRDITVKKKMEAELGKSSKIETLGVFAGGIAHDLNNFLTSILGNISLAKFDVDTGSDLYGTLQSAEEASMKTRDLARQLLSFTKCGEPVKEVTSIKELIIKSVKFALSGSSLNCMLDLKDDLLNVKIDRSQISQVIYNLVLNAVQAQGKNGNISISAMNVFHECSPSEENTQCFVKIIVKDSGHGIPEDIIDSIFDPFFTTKSEGSGLGLSIVYSIVKKHDGSISVVSPAGDGTTFEILIPATCESEFCIINKSDEVSPMSGKVLVVDDDKNIVIVLSKMFKVLGFSVDSVFDGESALRSYRMAKSTQNAYDIVIMDLTMRGGISGDEAAGLILDYDPEARIIVSSGYSNDSIMANYNDYGFIESLRKPYSIDDLKDVLAKIFYNSNLTNQHDKSSEIRFKIASGC